MFSSPVFLTLLTILCWSTGGSFSKALNLPGNANLYIITVLSSLVAYQALAWHRHQKLIFPSVKTLLSTKSFFSVFGYGIYWILIGLSMERSDNASVPMALNYTWPIFTAVFFELFFKSKDHITPRAVFINSFVGLAIGFIGVLALYLGDSSNHSTSLLSACFALLAGASYGLYGSYSSTIKAEDHLEFLILSCLTGIFALLPWALIENQAISNLSLTHIWIAVGFGLIVDGGGSYLWTRANRLISEQKSNIASITSLPLFLPFLSGGMLYLIYGEDQMFSLSFIIGLLLLTIGTTLCNKRSQ